MTEGAKVDLSSVSGIKQFLEKLGHDKAMVSRYIDRAVKEKIAQGLFSFVDSPDHISGKYVGSTGDTYTISIQLQHLDNKDTPDWADFVCSCPQAAKTNGLCKHSCAALIRRGIQETQGEDGNRPTATAVVPAQTVAPDPVNTSTAKPSHPVVVGGRVLPLSLTKRRDSPPPRKAPSGAPEASKSKAHAKPKQSRPLNQRWMTSEEMLAGDDSTLMQECRRVRLAAGGDGGGGNSVVERVKRKEEGVEGGYNLLQPQQEQEVKPSVPKEAKIEIDLTADEHMEEQRGSGDVGMPEAPSLPALPQPPVLPNNGMFSFMSLVQYDDDENT